MRIGFAVKVLGEEGIKECDLRRWQSGPHLKDSLAYLKNVFHYCDRADIRMYRMSSGLAPYLTHPDLPQFHNQLDEAAEELAELGQLARKYDLRLSLHPSQYIVLNAVDESIYEKSRADLIAQAAILDGMGVGDEAVVVTHVGGVYGDKPAAMERFARRYEALPESARRRLVLENDDVVYSVSDVLAIHQQCGIRIVFDNLHHFCNNPIEGRLSLREALSSALATWPEGQIPKIHYSSPRTESVEAARKKGKAGEMQTYQTAPESRLHSDYVNPFEFALVMEQAHDLRPFDVMVEAKAKDLAVIRLKRYLAAP